MRHLRIGRLSNEVSPRQMEGADDYGTELERLREWIDIANFRVGVQVLFHSLDPLEAAQPLSDIADCAVSMLLRRADKALGFIPWPRAQGVRSNRCQRQVRAARSGLPHRAGNRSLPRCAPGLADGRPGGRLRPRSTSPKLQRRVIAGLRGRPGARRVYDCIAIERAASIESLAGKLSRGSPGRPELCHPRTVAQIGRLAPRVRAMVHECFSAAHDEVRLRSHMASLRDGPELGPLHTGPWSVDLRPGGLLDIEVLVHYLRLRATPGASGIIGECTTGEALGALEQAGALAPEDCRVLLDGWRLWTRILTLQNLLGRAAREDAVPRRLRRQFQAAADTESFEDVESRTEAVASAVRAVHDRILGIPREAG